MQRQDIEDEVYQGFMAAQDRKIDTDTQKRFFSSGGYVSTMGRETAEEAFSESFAERKDTFKSNPADPDFDNQSHYLLSPKRIDPIIQDGLRTKALNGDPLAMAVLGKIYYDMGLYSKAFKYFSAVANLEQVDPSLVNAIANCINDEKHVNQQRRYHCLAIQKGSWGSVITNLYVENKHQHVSHTVVAMAKRMHGVENSGFTPPQWMVTRFHQDLQRSTDTQLTALFGEYSPTELLPILKILDQSKQLNKFTRSINNPERQAEILVETIQNTLIEEIIAAEKDKKENFNRYQIPASVRERYHPDYLKDIVNKVSQKAGAESLSIQEQKSAEEKQPSGGLSNYLAMDANERNAAECLRDIQELAFSGMQDLLETMNTHLNMGNYARGSHFTHTEKIF